MFGNPNMLQCRWFGSPTRLKSNLCDQPQKRISFGWELFGAARSVTLAITTAPPVRGLALFSTDEMKSSSAAIGRIAFRPDDTIALWTKTADHNLTMPSTGRPFGGHVVETGRAPLTPIRTILVGNSILGEPVVGMGGYNFHGSE
jgi:hypothetical protein